eukprot:8752089-Pyramimonas_sp.AAC.2
MRCLISFLSHFNRYEVAASLLSILTRPSASSLCSLVESSKHACPFERWPPARASRGMGSAMMAGMVEADPQEAIQYTAAMLAIPEIKPMAATHLADMATAFRPPFQKVRTLLTLRDVGRKRDATSKRQLAC